MKPPCCYFPVTGDPPSKSICCFRQPCCRRFDSFHTLRPEALRRWFSPGLPFSATGSLKAFSLSTFLSNFLCQQSLLVTEYLLQPKGASLADQLSLSVLSVCRGLLLVWSTSASRTALVATGRPVFELAILIVKMRLILSTT